VIEDVLKDAEGKMAKALETAKEDFATVRTGRANPAMFNKILVDYYGTPTPINQLASIQIPEARLVIITPYDKSVMSPIQKALLESDLGVNPNDDGVVIRVPLPQLTEERRKEYIKIVKTKGEDAKVSLRGVRRNAKEALEKLQKDGSVGKDDVHRAEKALDESTHRFSEQVDKLMEHKEAELLEV
jgi:ribosome recycling factor